jgi:hypothetical protein
MELAQILRYLAALLAAASGVLALLKSPTIDDKGGHRRLTRAGWISGSLIVAGLVIAILSIRVAKEDAKSAADAHRREVNAQTTLTSLTITWTFDHVPPTVSNHTSDTDDPCHEPNGRRYASRQDEFYPFLASLAGGRPVEKPVVLLVALDTAIANVLPLGMLDLGIRRVEGDLAWNDTDPARLQGVAATIDFRQDLEKCVGQEIMNEPQPVVDRPRRCNLETTLKRDGERVTLQWDLDAFCISKGVDKADPFVATHAQLPDQLTMVLLTSINDFPKSPENFAAWDKSLLWTPRTAVGRSFSDHSRVKLVANGSQSDAVEYDMRVHAGGTISGKGRGGEFHNEYPMLTTWVSAR